MSGTSSQVSELLRRWREGDQEALDSLVPLVYDELRRVAHNYLQRERPHHTLESTAVVHEAYLRLVEGGVEFQNREHFFAVAAQVMRQILVDYARRHRSLKRDGGYSGLLACNACAARPSRRCTPGFLPTLRVVEIDECFMVSPHRHCLAL
jgi:RNA polymerase sigma factor (TIGR02999 family)